MSLKQLIFSAEVSPVSPSVSQANDVETPTTAGSGPSSSESFALLGPDGCWLKTSQGYVQQQMDGSSEKYSGTWPRAGMTRNGIASRRPPSAPITRGTASGSWPTPTAIDRPNEGNVRLYRAKVLAGEMTEDEANILLGKSVWEKQGKVPAFLPTPNARDWKDSGPTQGNRHSPKIGTVVQRMWPTPRASANENRQTKRTPSQEAGRHGRSLAAEVGGNLNPRFVEWLQGYPDMWTDCGDSETPSSLKSLPTSDT